MQALDVEDAGVYEAQALMERKQDAGHGLNRGIVNSGLLDLFFFFIRALGFPRVYKTVPLNHRSNPLMTLQWPHGAELYTI